MADAEMAWTNLTQSVDVFHHLWLGAFRDSEPRLRGVHPTQKPTALMRWIVDRFTDPDDLVLDPYMGSGPVAQACHELGRRYIGCEVVEDYCRVAVTRLRQGVLNFDGGDAA
jgi:DNA modification methylase